MRTAKIRKIGLASGTALFLLAGCDGIDFSLDSTRSFAANYFQARKALEGGSYETAAARYAAMLPTAGPLASRLRLERAHALLRSDQYALAAQEARAVAAQHEDNRRSAALAVVGTAEHRMAQDAMSAGDFGAGTTGHLQRARAALREMLDKAPDLDPTGAMAQRLAMVETSLRNLGG